MLDSGSGENVCNNRTAPEFPIVPSEGSRRGQKFAGANPWKRIPNEGEQLLSLRTVNNDPAKITYQIADVRRPLTSVGRICDRGNKVIFGRGGGVITNLKTGHSIPVKREGNIYVLEMWIDRRAAPVSAFPRQGK